VGHVNANRNIPELSSLIENGRCLLVVGSTSTPEDSAVAYALRSAGAVLLREYRADIASLYRLADCYVFPVTAPTGAIDLPLSVLEAMACNLRVVTTRFGGLPTFFTEGEGLVFVNPGESLRCAVDRVLTHGIVRTRDQVMHLSWDAVARHILSTIGGERP
jgi:glycosyltransferase involved in cell wall biosynthesis